MRKEVVILGGGFAGVAAAKALLRHSSSELLRITLIDKNDYHLFTPSLYEVATSEVPKQNVAIPFSELFGKQVNVVKGLVSLIDTQKQHIVLHSGEGVAYDYLIVALGSEPAYYNIPGLKEHAISLKSLEDAVRIKNKIKTLCCSEGQCNRKVQVVVGGGGFAGTELAAELVSYKNKLAKQHHLDKDCLEVSVIQGSDRLLKELDSHVSRIAEKRIRGRQMHFCFGGHIMRVTETEVHTDDGKVYPYDMLLWTGGVTAHHLGKKSGLPINSHGQVMVNEYLQVQDLPHVFAAGDIAGVVNGKTNTPLPQVAQVAEDEGHIAGENVSRLLTQKQLLKYHFRHFGYIVPLRGRYAAAELMGFLHVDGLLGWVFQQLVFLNYLLNILPFWKAFKRWNEFEGELAQ